MTISIHSTSRAASSPGRYFDRVSLDPYYMHRHRTGRSTSTWVPAGPLLQHLSTLSYRPVDLPERRLRRDTIPSVQSVPLEPSGPCRRSATAPLIPTTSIHRTSSTSAIFSYFFLLSHRHHVQIAISRCFLSASLRILCSVHSDFR